MHHKRIFLMALLLLIVGLSSVHAQERIDREAFYNSPDGFHMLIPEGWENRSREEYAHFFHPEAGVNVYGFSVPTENIPEAINQSILLIEPMFEGEPVQTSSIILSNGTWTQDVYTSGLTAYGQVYEGNTYVILWYTDTIRTLAQPVIVPGEDVQAGIAAALDLLGEAPEDIVSTEERTFNGVTWTYNVYDSTPSTQVPFSAFGRVRGENTLVLANVTGRTPSGDLPVFFTILTDFFITPATAPYLYLGLAVTLLITIVFLGMMVLRTRSLHKDLETLEQLDAENKATA
jgi:hypothetical protein